MRITSNMLLQQSIQTTKSEAAHKLVIGAALTARVADVLNGVMTLDIGNGNQVMARDLSGRNFYQSQTVTFEVVGIDETDTLQIRPVRSESDVESDSLDLSLMLKRMNLSDTEGNRNLLRTLTAYRIPLNPDNIKGAQEMGIQVKGIVQLVNQTGTAALADHETMPLKQLAMQLIEITSPQVKAAYPESAPMGKFPAGFASAPLTETLAGVPGSSGTFQAVTLSSQADDVPKIRLHAEDPKTMAPDSMKINADLDGYSETASNQIKGSIRGEELLEVLRQTTFEKIGFIIKSQLPNNLGTLDSLEKLILGKKELGTQLQGLLNILPDDEAAAPLREAIQSAVKAVHLHPEMNPFELHRQLKLLNHALSILSAQTFESVMGNQHLKESLSEVKNSLDFLGRLNECATYLHVPVTLGEGTKPMNIYVQRDLSGKRRVNPQDTSIFISLETNNMETVQCLVTVQDHKLNIGFRMADPPALTWISKYFEPLKESLMQLGYKDVMIQGTVFQKRLNLMDMMQEAPLDTRRIDMRV